MLFIQDTRVYFLKSTRLYIYLHDLRQFFELSFVFLIYVGPRETWDSTQLIGIRCFLFYFILGFETNYLKNAFLYNWFQILS